jgi:hypothetical protein
MKLAATLARSLQADMQSELRAIERAVATGTREAGPALRTELRRQVGRAGLGQRLANSWWDKHSEPEARRCERGLYEGAADHPLVPTRAQSFGASLGTFVCGTCHSLGGSLRLSFASAYG